MRFLEKTPSKSDAPTKRREDGWFALEVWSLLVYVGELGLQQTRGPAFPVAAGLTSRDGSIEVNDVGGRPKVDHRLQDRQGLLTSASKAIQALHGQTSNEKLSPSFRTDVGIVCLWITTAELGTKALAPQSLDGKRVVLQG